MNSRYAFPEPIVTNPIIIMRSSESGATIHKINDNAAIFTRFRLPKRIDPGDMFPIMYQNAHSIGNIEYTTVYDRQGRIHHAIPTRKDNSIRFDADNVISPCGVYEYGPQNPYKWSRTPQYIDRGYRVVQAMLKEYGDAVFFWYSEDGEVSSRMTYSQIVDLLNSSPKYRTEYTQEEIQIQIDNVVETRDMYERQLKDETEYWSNRMLFDRATQNLDYWKDIQTDLMYAIRGERYWATAKEQYYNDSEFEEQKSKAQSLIEEYTDKVEQTNRNMERSLNKYRNKIQECATTIAELRAKFSEPEEQLVTVSLPKSLVQKAIAEKEVQNQLPMVLEKTVVRDTVRLPWYRHHPFYDLRKSDAPTWCKRLVLVNKPNDKRFKAFGLSTRADVVLGGLTFHSSRWFGLSFRMKQMKLTSEEVSHLLGKE